MKNTIAVWLALFFLVWGASETSAYVLQGPHILELMVQKTGKARSLKVTQRLVLQEGDPDENGIELTETLRYSFPEKFRSDIESENIRRIHVVAGDTGLTVIDGKITADTGTWFDSYKDILLYRSRRLLQDRLIRCGVDVRVSSLGRFQGRIAFVVGAQYPDESVSQLWVEKDTFRPIRWLIVKKDAESPENFLDIRYFGWKPVGKIWYPMRIEFHRNKQMLREIRVDDVMLDPGFADNLFDVAYLRSVYRTTPTVEDDRAGEEEINEVQKAIEEFKKIYE